MHVSCRLQEWLGANATGEMDFNEFCGWFHLVHAEIDRLRPHVHFGELETLQAENTRLKQELSNKPHNAECESERIKNSIKLMSQCTSHRAQNRELKAEVQKLRKLLSKLDHIFYPESPLT